MAALDMGIYLTLLTAFADTRLANRGHKIILLYVFLGLQFWVMSSEIWNNHLQTARVKFDVWLIIYERRYK